jgi:hypothetical protein
MNDTCKCGHSREDHDTRLPKLPCLVGWYGHAVGCECEGFEVQA